MGHHFHLCQEEDHRKDDEEESRIVYGEAVEGKKGQDEKNPSRDPRQDGARIGELKEEPVEAQD